MTYRVNLILRTIMLEYFKRIGRLFRTKTHFFKINIPGPTIAFNIVIIVKLELHLLDFNKIRFSNNNFDTYLIPNSKQKRSTKKRPFRVLGLVHNDFS